jgi:hypothetical protein
MNIKGMIELLELSRASKHQHLRAIMHIAESVSKLREKRSLLQLSVDEIVTQLMKTGDLEITIKHLTEA